MHFYLLNPKNPIVHKHHGDPLNLSFLMKFGGRYFAKCSIEKSRLNFACRIFFVTLFLILPLFGFSQDIIEKKNGEQIKGRVILIDKKTVVYKPIDDPEFTSYTLSQRDLKSVRYENGRLVLFGLSMPQHYVAFGAGTSIPTGELRAENIDETVYAPGYMKAGGFARFDAGIYLYKGLGLALQVGGMNFKVDKDAMFDDLINDGGENAPAEVRLYDKKDTTEETKTADFNNLSAGFLYSKKIKQNHTIDIRIMGGMLMMRTKSQLEQRVFHPDDASLTTYVSRTYDVPTRGVFTLGAAYRYDIATRWAIRVSADWYHSSLKRTYTIDAYGAGASLLKEGSNTDYVKFRTINLGLGIVYQFNRKNY